MTGQVGFFAFHAPQKVPLAIQRYVAEVGRLFDVLERRLAQTPYLAGDEFTMADIAFYPWMVGATTRAKDVVGGHLHDKPAIGRWMDDLAARPGVHREMAITPPAKASSIEESDQEVNA